MLRTLLPLCLCMLVQSCGRQSEAKDSPPHSISEQTTLISGENPEKTASVQAEKSSDSADVPSLIRHLIDPAKLATLGDRKANPKVQQITAFLWQAKSEGQDPAKVAERAVELIGWGKTEKGRLTAEAMVRNVAILEQYGSTTEEDLHEMMRGRTATVRKGPNIGQILSVDHVIPRAVAPELDKVIANLELLPLSLNETKGDKIGERQISLAKAFHDAGLLSDAGFQNVMEAKQ